ncbi:MAG TPA: ABC transporter permease [Puia sp.]|nr:ABC transporter permease [Puia sp.]
MIKNYFKTAFRNLWKNRLSSGINIFGLTIGITSCLLIVLYIRHELSYDAFQRNGDRIVRVIMEYSFNGSPQSAKGNYTSVRVAPVLKKTFPEVESGIRMVKGEEIISFNDKLFREKDFMFADSNFFDFFSFRLLRGDPHRVLAGPRQVVLTESTERKYFGADNAIGSLIRLGDDSSMYKVTGIMQDCPSNSQIKFNMLASFSSLGLGHEYEESYWDANYTTYLLLKDRQSAAGLQAKLPAFMKKEMEGQGATVNFYLEPFLKIHLYSEYGGFEPNNNISYIYVLASVALLILVIACSTYINLSTAQSMERAREVGVRKVIGAGRKQLFWQFIGESFSLCIIAVVLSITLATLLMPYFNQLTDRRLETGSLLSIPFLAFSCFTAALVSLLAGSYPALILSGYQPAAVLKGSLKHAVSGQWLRKSLVVFQFAISVFLIIATFLVQKQLYYIQHKKLGYDRSEVLVLPMDQQMLSKLSVIKQQFKSNPDVISVSRCARSPVEGGGGYNMRSSVMPSDRQIAVTANPVDEDFVRTTGLEIIAGANLTEQDIKDVSFEDRKQRTYHFILNESAARQLGWTPEEAVGKKMFLDDSRPGYVRGVVRDFHFESLHQAIKPFILFPELRAHELLVKLSGRNMTATLSFLENQWKKTVPDKPFEYHFLNEDYDKLYHAELRLGKVMNLFSGIAIILACLGLFGLSSYSTRQRVKEIGIRKVLGASVSQIVVTLSKDFVVLSLVALLIAFPLAWWAMSKWLTDFSYRTSMNWEIFALAGIITLLLVILTVALRAVRAAVANPVASLRTD